MGLQLKVRGKETIGDSGDLFGIFFEDINHSADGGVYAELIQNRAFEFDPIDNGGYHHLTGWDTEGDITVSIEDTESAFTENPHYCHVTAGKGGCLKNGGFHKGIQVQAGQRFNASVWAKSDRAASLVFSLEADGERLAEHVLEIEGPWKKYEFDLTADSAGKAFYTVTIQAEDEVYLDFISLFPADTWKNRKYGLRRDLVQALYDLHPAFMRFPGGCLVHDGSLNRNDRNALYFWKNTIGPVEKRASRRNNWGYNQTLGLGYFEYFQLCEDIGATPLPVLAAGYNPHSHKYVEISELGEFIDDALDLIEFANGSADTVWGKKRCELGHEEPFNMRYIAIGNEELWDPFMERFPYFEKAIHEKYPDIKVISSSGPFADGYDFDIMWMAARKAKADLVDEHFYMSTDWFRKNMNRYDSYSRRGPKVFLGEYGSWGNKYKNALVEAAFMTGMERNADVVGLACYAPLFCNKDYLNWAPDMIWYDGTHVAHTANYYVQQMFMKARGQRSVPFTLEHGDGLRKSFTEPDIFGNFFLETRVPKVTLYDLCVNGEVLSKEMQITNDSCERDYHRTDLGATEGDVTISFDYEVAEGQTQLILGFGEKKSGDDTLEVYRWEIGGWANDMSCLCRQRQGDRQSVINTGRGISVKADGRHHVEFSLSGHSIKAKVDGVIYHDFCEADTVTEPLYVSATAGKEEIYLKLVNLEKTDKELYIILDDNFKKVLTTVLTSEDMEAENVIGEKECVTPDYTLDIMYGNTYNAVVPAESVTVLTFSK